MIESAVYVAVTLMFSVMMVAGLLVFELSDRNIFAMIVTMALVFVVFLLLLETVVISFGGSIA